MPTAFIEKAREEMQKWTSHERQAMLSADSARGSKPPGKNRPCSETLWNCAAPCSNSSLISRIGTAPPPDRARNPYSKARVAVDRIARVKWIKEILMGNIVGTECWHVRPQSGRNHPLDRPYVHWAYGYVVWLQPRKDGGWRFSSAFPAPQAEIARFTRGAACSGAWKRKTKAPVISRFTGQKPYPPP